ncbi:MAG TPA: aminopeptidase [Chloroflexia bacterium]|nr:aminopeptidase [Chloroflexia bacterium]
MLLDPRVERMATTITRYSLGVQPGWMVTVNAGPAAMPLVLAFYTAVLEAGAHPFVLSEIPGAAEILLAEGSEQQLTYADPYRLYMVEKSDAVLRILSEENTRSTSNTDPVLLGLQKKGQAPISAGFSRRIAEARPHCLTLFPTQAYAQDAEMSLSEFEDFVFRACFVDGDGDPAERWRELSREQQRIVDWLAGKHNVIVEGRRTDLSFSIEGRTFINSDGKRNFPSGEVFTSPVHETVEGTIYFDYPSSYNGRTVQGVELAFEGGVVTRASAQAGEDFLKAMLDLDPGARRLGEFAIGTNAGVDRITRNVLFDEKIAGTIHCALGNAYPNAGGTNTSAIHWDIVKDMREGRVVVDGETLYENGKFAI